MVPCGKCLGCRGRQARDWAIRLQHEAFLADQALFITLTYEIPPDDNSLVPGDLQRWLKRIRRRHKGRLSFYGVGEYGDITARPHYHAILIGSNLLLDRERIGRRSGYWAYHSDTLQKSWKHGFATCEAMGYGAAAYVAGYVRKKIDKLEHEDRYTRVHPDTGELVEVEPEFSRMSRRPPIGARFLERMWRDIYPRDYVVLNGRQFKPPRYYDRWMEQDHSQKEYSTCTDCAEHYDVFQAVRDQRWEDKPEEVSKYELKARSVRAHTLNKLHHQRTAV